MSELAAVLAGLPQLFGPAFAPGAPAGIPARVTISTPPPALAALAAGQVFRGVSVGRTAEGRTLVETRFGRLSLDLAEPPARGVTLRLEVTRPGTPMELRAGAPVEAAAGRPAAPAPQGLAVGATLSGRFAADDAAAASDGRIVLRIVALGDSGRPLPTSTLAGIVTASPAGGPTTIRTATGTITLPDIGGAPAGTRLAMQAVATPGTVAPSTGASAAGAVADLTGGWPALAEAVAAAPGAVPAPLVAAIPQSGPALAAGLALFLQALRGGTGGWPGTDALDALARAGRRPLGERIEQDFGRLSRLAGEPAGDGWRVALVPLLDDGRLDQLRVYLRGGRDTQGDGDADLRFVVEASLSRLGRMQFDGLVAGHRFDLLIRTLTPLGAAMRADIGEIFERISLAAGSGGALRFQVVTAFPVAPLEAQAGVAPGVYA